MLFIIPLTLCLAVAAESVKDILFSPRAFHELILCRLCGHDISSSNHIISKSSLESEYSYNETLFSKERVLVQVLSAGYILDIPIITFDHSECAPIGEWSKTELWFPDYSWKACVCPSCGEIVGWVFKPIIPSRNRTSNMFYALDLHSLVGENFLNLLVEYPVI